MNSYLFFMKGKSQDPVERCEPPEKGPQGEWDFC